MPGGKTENVLNRNPANYTAARDIVHYNKHVWLQVTMAETRPPHNTLASRDQGPSRAGCVPLKTLIYTSYDSMN